jgi:ABC-2 type transport system ATP-binding protein
MIEMQGLCKRYPGASKAAVDDLHLSIAHGEVFGLLGPNGAGKTTTISMLSTILQPDQGTIILDGIDVRQHPRQARQNIGLVPQEIALYPELTAWENLAFFGRLYGLHGRHLKNCIQSALTAVGLETKAHQKVVAYSGGMKRRTNLAAGILHGPKLLFLDEPTVGVDIQSRQLILDRLGQIQTAGTTMIYTTHYMEEAQQICDRVAIMDAGKILVQGPPDELIDQATGCQNLGALFLRLTGKQLRD